MLDGFKSLWMRPAECKYKIDFAIWYKIYFLCFSSSIFYRMRVKRSTSRCSKTRYISFPFSALITYSKIMTFGCFNSNKNMIYRYVRCASVELLKASKFFFRAFVFFVFRSVTLNTWPYAPLPIFLITLYFARICGSISSDIWLLA